MCVGLFVTNTIQGLFNLIEQHALLGVVSIPQLAGDQLAVEVHLEGARLLDVLGDVVHDKNDSHKNPLLGTELVEELLGNQIRVRRLRELGLKAAKNRQR